LSDVSEKLREAVAQASPGPWQSLEALSVEHFTSWVVATEVDEGDDLGEFWRSEDAALAALAPDALLALAECAEALAVHHSDVIDAQPLPHEDCADCDALAAVEELARRL